jgi:hypothetical protein
MNSLFNRTKYVEGGDIDDIRITFENLMGRLQDSKYDEGIDADTMVLTIADIYKYVTDTSRGKALRLPAPANNPDDKYNTMWPEGAKVRTRSRRDSHASRASSVTSNGIRIPKINQAYTHSRASSNTSSKYAPVRARFIEDDVPDQGVRSFNMRDIRDAAPTVPRNTSSGQSRPSMDYTRQRSYNDNVERIPAPAGRARPRFSRQEPVDEEEVEQIDTRGQVARSRVSDQRAEPRRANRPVFLEDEN